MAVTGPFRSSSYMSLDFVLVEGLARRWHHLEHLVQLDLNQQIVFVSNQIGFEDQISIWNCLFQASPPSLAASTISVGSSSLVTFLMPRMVLMLSRSSALPMVRLMSWVKATRYSTVSSLQSSSSVTRVSPILTGAALWNDT